LVTNADTNNGVAAIPGTTTPSEAEVGGRSQHNHSASIPTTNAVTDIFAGHTTWRSYYAMLRVYKVYSFGFWPVR
jgi:hypothetical protein